MRTFTKFALLAAGLAVFLGVAGCRRPHYGVSLESGEHIAVGDPVFLDNRTIGKVAQITQSDNGRVADITIVDREARQAFRQGIQREGPGAMRLSSVGVAPDAPALKAGAVIPTRSPIGNLSKGAMAAIQDWAEAATEWAWANPFIAIPGLLVALIILVGVLRAILTRGAFLLFFLLVLAASAANLQAAVKRTEVARALQVAEQQMDRAEQDAADARRLTEARLFHDGQEAGVRSLLLCYQVGAAEPAIRSGIERLGFFVSVETKADFQQRCARLADRRAAVADELAPLGPAAPSQERLLSLFMQERERIYAQLAKDGITDPVEVIGRLRLLARFPAKLVNEDLVNWANVADLGQIDGDTVSLPDGTRIGSVPVVAPVTPKTPDADRLARVEQMEDQLRADFTTLAKTAAPISGGLNSADNRASTHVPDLAPVAKPASGPVAPAVLKVEITAVESRPAAPVVAAIARPDAAGSMVMNPVAPTGLEKAPPATTVSVPAVIPPILAHNAESAKPLPAHQPERIPDTKVGRVTSRPRWVLGVLAAAMAVAGGLLLLIGKARSSCLVTLADEHGDLSSHEVGGDEIVLLGNPPRVDFIDSAQPEARIRAGWRGPVLVPGSMGSVEIGEKPVVAPCRVNPGDHISIKSSIGPSISFDLLSIEPLNASAARDA